MKIKKESIKRITKEISIGILILFVVSNIISYLRKPDLKDDLLPKLIAQTINSKQIDLDDYKGEPILIHFWATWCPVCKMEISNIQRVSSQYKVITIAVNSGKNSEIKSFLKTKEADFLVINDPKGEISSRFNIEVFPTTLIYGSSGKLVFSEVGYSTTVGLLSRMLWANDR